jgi:hypothetical protein
MPFARLGSEEPAAVELAFSAKLGRTVQLASVNEAQAYIDVKFRIVHRQLPHLVFSFLPVEMSRLYKGILPANTAGLLRLSTGSSRPGWAK